MKKENGITLVALVITIILLLIIAGVSIKVGTDVFELTRLQGFYTQLEMIQKRVDDIAATNEYYIDNNGNKIYLKMAGKDITATQSTLLQSILTSENIDLEVDSFRYFDIQDLEEILDLSDMSYNVFINFEDRVIVAEEGIKVEDITYYVLRNTTYFVEKDSNKNIGEIESLSYKVTPYTEDYYKVVITAPSGKIGDLGETGYIRYKSITSKYWETSNNTEIIIRAEIKYEIIYIDANNNQKETAIIIELDDEGNPTISEI